MAESQVTKNALNQQKIEHLESELKELKSRVDNLAEERNNYLKWGVITLGSTLVGLCTYIVSLFSEQIK
jgi:uncharacterized membrane protein YjjP (DUF1212 family)